MAALLGGGANGRGKVLNRETLSVMTEPHYRLDERLPAMGLAFLLDDFGEHRVAGHDGGWPGFLSSMHICPAFKVGVVVFVNASSRAAHEAADGLMRGLLGVPEPSSRLPRAGVLESPHLWSELRGFYGPEGPLNTNLRLWGTYAGELEVRVEGKHLVLRALAGPLRKGGRLYPIDSLDPLAFEVLVEGQAHPVVFGREREGGPREQVVRRVRPADQAPEGREPALQGAGRGGDGFGRSNVDRRKGTASAEGTLRSVDGPRRYLRVPLRLATIANAHHKLREVGFRLPHPYLLGPIYLQRIEQIISTRLAPALHACANRSLSMTRSPDKRG